MGGVYPYSLFHDILIGREREREKEREREEREREREKGKERKGKRERERGRGREGKNRLRICDYGIFFLPLHARQIPGQTDKQDKHCPPLHIKTD